MSTPLHTEEREGFTIRFYAEPEFESPRGQFQNEDGSDDEDIIGKIESGYYDWFCAKVTASKAGVELASDYLGGCCYDTALDFVKAGGYYDDMISTVIADAKRTIAELTL